MTHCLSAVSIFHGCSWMHRWRVSCRRHFQRTSFVSVAFHVIFSPASTNCNATSPYIPLWVSTSSWRLSKLLSTERKVVWFFEVSRDTWSPSCRDSRGSCRFYQTFGTPHLENTHLDAEGVSHQIWKRSSYPHFPEAEPLVQSPCVSRERNLNENDWDILGCIWNTSRRSWWLQKSLHLIWWTNIPFFTEFHIHQQYDKGSHLGSANWPSSFGGWF